ncbi:MAG: RagB/SusD family nutrient uptake outer membrane protein [Bacteroidales bacterium]|nr:RagB/SusD family nutrient uptake outer membrane protein [Bacteroidales bacterium]
MKNIFKISLVLFLAGCLCGCSALEQRSKSTFEANTVFANYTLARYAVNAIYEAYITTGSYREDYPEQYGVNTDIERRASLDDTEQNNYAQYKMSPNNSRFDRPGEEYYFSGNFKGIERANLCIKGLKEYGNIDENAQMGALYGEALTARALLYADLLNLYGEVPARFEPITQETIYLPKSDKDVIYKQLLSDLETAAKYMSYEGQQYITYPGKACAQGMYARLALQASGYSCRPDEGKVNTGAMGTVRKSNDPELQASVLYPKALEALKDVIENSGLGLAPKFEDIWKFFCDMGATYRSKENPEIIFGLPFGENRGQFLTRNAVPNTKYNVTSNPRVTLMPSFYFKFDPDDTRRDITGGPLKYGADGKATDSGLTAGLMYIRKFRMDWRSPEHAFTQSGAEDGCKIVYLRYADILLMAAEIANELGNLDEAKGYMRPVLVRAYQNEEKADDYLGRLTDKESFFDAVKDQRAFEFAGERLRKADLIRWGILKQAIDEAKVDLQCMHDLTGKFSQFNNTFWWRLKENSIEAEFYGLNPGETDTPPNDGKGTWTKKTYFSTLGQTSIDNLYLEDPDMYMYRPIPATIITANLGVLKNDYGYTF